MDEKILHNLILDYIDSPIWLMNEHYELLAHNESFIEVFGMISKNTPSQGDSFIKMFNEGNDVEIWQSSVEKTLKEGKDKFTYSLKIGDKLTFFEVKTFLVETDSDPKQISVIANDITETKDFERELAQQNSEFKKINQELDNFVYSVSHQIRSPLTSLLGLINIAKIDKSDKTHEYLDHMQASIENLDHTVHEINDYSKNARLEVKVEKISFPKIWDEIISDYSFGNRLNTFNIVKNIEESGDFYSDATRIKVIISNIFSNSIKFNDLEKDESTINVKIKVRKQVARIIITDNGEGIEEEALSKIFDMFYRASQSSVRGAGLGLYVVKEIVNKLNGTIAVESKLGNGSKFIIELPSLS